MNKSLKSRRGKGSISILNNNGSIKLQWSVASRRFTLSPGKKYDELGIKACQRAINQIELDLLSGNFDPSLDKYRQLLGISLSTPSIPAVEKKIQYDRVLPLWQAWIKLQEISAQTYNAKHKCVLSWLEKKNPKVADIAIVLSKEKNWANLTWNDRYSLLNACLNWGLKQGFIASNPLTELEKKPALRKNETRKPFSKAEVQAILKAFEENQFLSPSSRYQRSDYYPFVKFLFLTGCRPGEAMALQWKHVDFEQGQVLIAESLARGENGASNPSKRVRKDTKTHNERLLPMSQELRALLASLKGSRGKDELVFHSPKGNAIDDRMFLRRHWKPVLEGLQIPYRVPYAMRHTFGTRAIDQNIPINAVAYMMGHAKIDTTIKNYVHKPDSVVLPEIL